MANSYDTQKAIAAGSLRDRAMSELVEQVARAIHDVLENDDDSKGGGYMRAARAALSVLEPRIEALEAENFKLAAGACNVEGGLIGDDHGHFYCSLKARIEALERELAEARDYARKVSIAFADVTGGGSEMFTRIGDEFYADPEACRARVRERYESAQKLGAVRAAAIRKLDGERGG